MLADWFKDMLTLRLFSLTEVPQSYTITSNSLRETLKSKTDQLNLSLGTPITMMLIQGQVTEAEKPRLALSSHLLQLTCLIHPVHYSHASWEIWPVCHESTHGLLMAKSEKLGFGPPGPPPLTAVLCTSQPTPVAPTVSLQEGRPMLPFQARPKERATGRSPRYSLTRPGSRVEASLLCIRQVKIDLCYFLR